jgi:hypothetical protein
MGLREYVEVVVIARKAKLANWRRRVKPSEFGLYIYFFVERDGFEGFSRLPNQTGPRRWVP